MSFLEQFISPEDGLNYNSVSVPSILYTPKCVNSTWCVCKLCKYNIVLTCGGVFFFFFEEQHLSIGLIKLREEWRNI